MTLTKKGFALAGLAACCLACAPGKSGPDREPPALMAPAAEADTWAADTLGRMTLEAKIGQMIVEQVRGEYKSGDDPEYLRILSLVRDRGLGGLVVYGGTPQDTARLLNRLQEAAALPLLVAADFEGGPGQQFRGATEFPGNMALSAVDSEALAYDVGRVGATEGRAIGVHLTYSPSVDLLSQPENPVLGVRSFGPDLERLGRLAGAYIRGYQENGMLATAKHYPGRGDVRLIPGTEFTVNDRPAGRVEAEDLAAFKKAIDAGVAFIMSEHIAVPALTSGSDLPASVEKTLAGDWLRNRLGFRGVLTTDDMWYKKVTERFGPVRACVLAVQSGHDAVLKPADASAAIDGLTAAVRAGEIPEAQIDASVRRILFWKARLNLHRNRFVDERRIFSSVGIAPHRELVRRIADESLALIVNRDVFPVRAGKLGRLVHLAVQKKEADAAPAAVAARLEAEFPGTATFFLRPDVSSGLYERALAAVRKADTVVVSLFSQRTLYGDNSPIREEDLEFLKRVGRVKPGSVLVMSYGNPYHVKRFGDAAAFAVGWGEGGFYGNQLAYADSFIRLLKGEIAPKGRLPVRASEAFPEGSGIVY